MTEVMRLAAQCPAMQIIPLLAFGTMLAEWLYIRLALHDASGHDFKETAASIATAIGNQLMRPVAALLVAFPLYLAYQFRLLEIPSTSVAALVVVFVLVDFVEYWFHRTSHRVRLLWATHAVHHSATNFNLTAAVRIGWTAPLSGMAFFLLPLALLGFHPLAIMAMVVLNLFYQFFLHTEHAPHLGGLEWVLNTPTHHRVHHATNAACLDKNFAGVFIVWDRLFSTFAAAPSDEKLQYGLTTPLPSQNPLTVNFFEWRRLLRDVRRTQGLRRRLKVLFAMP
jgi:sterol desaturase/sphingolipid hydroxylase (fatty acid hydroxylase superfamily)